MELNISDAVQQKIEHLGLLHVHIQEVISHAENMSQKLFDAKSGRFVSHKRIGNITCWVEYTEDAGSFTVGNVYMHRMEIEGEEG